MPTNPNPNPNPNPETPSQPPISPRELRRLMREQRRSFLADAGLDGGECQVPPDAATAADHRNPRRRRQDPDETPEVGTLVHPGPQDTLDNLTLYPDCVASITAGLRAIEIRSDLERIWNISRLEPQGGRCILNFYGPPGTGKTRAAMAIARRLGKPVYQVDYAAIISKYLGDTAKHIVFAFRRAAELGAILFFDEADSLCSRRVDAGESCSTSINQNRNVLMQELDRFDGVVIMTTNLFTNFDPALLRRVARHIEFKLPNQPMRRKIIAWHLPNPDMVTGDLNLVAIATKGFGGGDIKNVCLNAIYGAASATEDRAQWRVSASALLVEAEKIRAAKEAHARRDAPGARRHIAGFQAEHEIEAELES